MQFTLGSPLICRLGAMSMALALVACGGGSGGAGSTPTANTPAPTSNAPNPPVGVIDPVAPVAPVAPVLPSGPPAGASCPTSNSNVALAGGTQLAVGASRAAGVAPLAVFFDASGTTATSTSRPFHELEYRWTFGESGSGTWNYGAKAGTASRNEALGPVAAHVFESAGTFPITVSAFNGTSTVSYSCNITVASADAEFAGNKTVCVSGIGNFAGCPVGATQVTSANATTAVSGNIGTGNKRILFRRGEGFSVGASISINRGGPSQIGAYGTPSSPRPVFSSSVSGPVFYLSSATTPTQVSNE